MMMDKHSPAYNLEVENCWLVQRTANGMGTGDIWARIIRRSGYVNWSTDGTVEI